MDGDINASFLFIFIKKFGDFLDRFVVASICGAENDENPDCILVEELFDLLEIEAIIRFFANRNNASFDFEIACEFPAISKAIGWRYSRATWALAPIRMFGFE